MKTFKSIIAILTICMVTISSCYGSEKTTPFTKKKDLTSEIISILGSPVKFPIDGNSEAEVTFTVNAENEIIVVSVSSENREFRHQLKRALNFKKISSRKLTRNKLYILPIQLKNIES